MKKVVVTTALILGIIFSNYAQDKCFQKGNVLLNPGIGLGSNYSSYTGFQPSLSFSADIGVHDYVSAGPYVGASFFKDATGIDVGGRANFHWWQLLDDKVSADLKQSQFELYSTLWLGVEFITFKDAENTGVFDAGFTLGARWYPNSNDRFALHGEFGYTPVSFSTIGATIKIGQ